MSVTRSRSTVAVAALLLVLVNTAAAAIEPSSVPVQRIVATDGGLADAFGFSLDIDAGRLVVGTAGDTPPSVAAARIYVLDRTSDGWWVETLIAPDTDSREASYAVAVSGDRIVSGGPYGSSIYLFERQSSGAWLESQLSPPDPREGDAFGSAVAIDGETIVVGAPGDDTNGLAAGAAYVFQLQPAGWESTKLLPAIGAANDEFGWSVAVAGETIIVGQPHRFCCDPEDTEAAYVFEPDGSGGWAETRLMPEGTPDGDSFGFSVATDGHTVVVGAPRPNDTGSAYVFTRGSDGLWERNRVQPENPVSGDDFGWAVGINSGRVLIGAPHRYAGGTAGTAHVFSKDPADGGWVESEFYQDPDYDAAANARWFGHSVALAHDRAIVSAPHDDAVTWDAGILYEFGESVPSENRFVDDDGNVHETNIELIAARGITRGCNPPINDHFCPRQPTTRAETATFLDRALHLAPTELDWFADDDGSVHEAAINRLAAAGITLGCNPPHNSRYCPGGPISRAEFAALLARAFALPAPPITDIFVDDDGSVFELVIDKIGAAGITIGCNPPVNDRFCPDDPVHRDEMASLLIRALTIR